MMQFYLMIFSILLIAQPLVAQCKSDIECKGDRICVEGVCVDPKSSSTENVTPVASSGSDVTLVSNENSTTTFRKAGWVALSLDIGAAAQFGPVAYLEIRTLPGIYIGAHYRYMSIGPIYRALTLDDDYNEKMVMSSASCGGNIRYYFQLQSSPHMPYAGISIDGFWGSNTGNDKYDQYRPYTDEIGGTIYTSDFGFRWRFGAHNAFLLSLGVSAGVAILNKDITKYSAYHEYSGYTHYNDEDANFYGMLSLCFGVGM